MRLPTRSHPMQAALLRPWVFGFALLGLTLLGAWLRYPALHGDLWMDEIWSFQIAHAERSVMGLLTHQTWANNHLLSTLWLRFLEESAPEIWFRLPSFVCGLLSIPLAAWLLRRWGSSRPAALLGAGAVALSFFQIQFSTEARGYAGAFACALLALGLRFPDRVHPVGGRAPLAFGVVQITGMLWHPGYVLFVVGLAASQGILAALRTSLGPPRARWAEWLRWQAIPAVALGVYHGTFLSRLRYGAAGYQEPFQPMMEAAGWTLNLAGTAWGPPLACVLLLTGFAFAVVRLFPIRPELGLALLLTCAVLPVALFLAHPPRVTANPSLLVLFPRYFYLPFGVALVAAAWGIGTLDRAKFVLAAGTLLLLLGAGLLVLLPPFHRHGRGGYQQVLAYLADREPGRVRLATNEQTRGSIQFGFYARRMGLTDRFVWIEPAQWLLAPPDYMVSLAQGRLPARIDPPRITGGRREIRFGLVQVFPYAGASGFHCAVFKRTDRAPESP